MDGWVTWHLSQLNEGRGIAKMGFLNKQRDRRGWKGHPESMVVYISYARAHTHTHTYYTASCGSNSGGFFSYFCFLLLLFFCRYYLASITPSLRMTHVNSHFNERFCMSTAASYELPLCVIMLWLLAS